MPGSVPLLSKNFYSHSLILWLCEGATPVGRGEGKKRNEDLHCTPEDTLQDGHVAGPAISRHADSLSGIRDRQLVAPMRADPAPSRAAA